MTLPIESTPRKVVASPRPTALDIDPDDLLFGVHALHTSAPRVTLAPERLFGVSVTGCRRGRAPRWRARRARRLRSSVRTADTPPRHSRARREGGRA